jgi:hypothetical protein
MVKRPFNHHELYLYHIQVGVELSPLSTEKSKMATENRAK